VDPTNSSSSPVNILIVDDDDIVLYFLQETLEMQGHTVKACKDPTDAVNILAREEFQIMFSDMNMPKMTGLALLRKAKAVQPEIDVILVTGFATIETAVEAMRIGAYDYIVKPLNTHEIKILVDRVLMHARMRKDLDRANELNKLKDEFIGNLSHELRTPIAVVFAATQTLQNDLKKIAESKHNNNAMEMAAMILDNSQKTISILNDLADAFRSGRKSIVLSCESVDICALVKDCVETVQPLISEKKITVDHNCVEKKLLIEADPVKLRQVFLNLLGNSIKFTPSGGKVTITSEKIGEEISVSVQDTGIGIAEEEQNRVFDKFYQVKNAKQANSTSFGLGLALVKAIVEAHGWKISVSSRLGQGCTFEIRLPVGNRGG